MRRAHAECMLFESKEMLSSTQLNQLLSPNCNFLFIIRSSAGKMSKIGFVTPFESATYIAALERSLLLNIPLRVSFNLDIENNHVDAVLKPINSSQYQRVLQWISLPYTTRHDILSLKPANEDSNAKIIHVRPAKTVSLSHFLSAISTY